MNKFVITLLGDKNVGKTSICKRFCYDTFIENYESSTEDQYIKEILIKNEKYNLELIDFDISDEYSSFYDELILKSDFFLLIFDITSKKSFDNIENYYNRIKRLKNIDNNFIILCGNKFDIINERKVLYFDKTPLINRLNIKYFEISVKDNQNISKLFQTILKRINIPSENNNNKEMCKI